LLCQVKLNVRCCCGSNRPPVATGDATTTAPHLRQAPHLMLQWFLVFFVSLMKCFSFSSNLSIKEESIIPSFLKNDESALMPIKLTC